MHAVKNILVQIGEVFDTTSTEALNGTISTVKCNIKQWSTPSKFEPCDISMSYCNQTQIPP